MRLHILNLFSLLLLLDRVDAWRNLRHGQTGRVSTVVASTSQMQNTLEDVVEILSQMLKDLNTQGDEDKANWEAYTEFSDKTEADKQSFLQDQKSFVMSTTATLKANEQMVQRLTEDIGGLANDIAQTKKSLRELKEMRKQEHQQFQASLADLGKTIRAVARAAEIIEGNQASGASLGQIAARVQIALSMYARQLDTEEKQSAKSLMALIQGGDPDFLNVKGDEKYGSYKSRGGGVLDLLNSLHTQLNQQEKELTEKESEARNQFEQTKSGKETDLKHMKDTKVDKEAKKEECLATIQKCGTDITQAKREIRDATEDLALLLQDRQTFSDENTERITTRSGEVQATQAALDALQAISAGAKSTVAAVLLQRGKELKAAKQQASSTSLRQASETRKHQRFRSTFMSLASLGKEMQNEALVKAASLALHANTMNPDAMEPVKRLLSDLIDRLEAEHSAEMSQHDWCEAEKTTGARSKEERERTLKGLKASIESETTAISTLKTGILKAESEISRVQSETREAQSIRDTEHNIFLSAKTDHEEVINAIKTALDALKGQYGLIQRNQRQGQSPFQDYSSGAGGAASALEMLEDLQTRYSNALQGLESREKAAQEAHDDLVSRNTIFVADMTSARDSDMVKRRQKLNDLADDKSEVKTNMLELHQVVKYLQDLRPSCDDIRSTFEERSKRRGAEIDALKEALEVLEDPTAMDV